MLNDSAAAVALGWLSWEETLSGWFDGTIRSARAALVLDSSQAWIGAKPAHALVLSGTPAASKMYRAHRGQRVTDEQRPSRQRWEDVLAADAREVEAAHLRAVRGLRLETLPKGVVASCGLVSWVP